MDLDDLKKHWIDGDKIRFVDGNNQLYINDKHYYINDYNLYDDYMDWLVIQSCNLLKDACSVASENIKHGVAGEETYYKLIEALQKSDNY